MAGIKPMRFLGPSIKVCLRWARIELAIVLALTLISVDSVAAQNEVTAPGRTDAASSVVLAARLEHGESIPRDYQHALGLYCEAARRGDPMAFFNIGWMYLNGRGVIRNDAVAVSWFRKAAERGIPQAANLLNVLSGIVAARGSGCPSRNTLTINNMIATGPVRKMIDDTAGVVGLKSKLLDSVILVESGFNPKAISEKNAAGLMQLMPETAAQMGVRDPFNPAENIRGGATYLRSLISRFHGDLNLGLAAYNAGEGAVRTHGGVPPFPKTRAYVAKVKRLCACE